MKKAYLLLLTALTVLSTVAWSVGVTAFSPQAAKQSPATESDGLVALITSADQLSSPWTETYEGSLEALLDGDTYTFWHSEWTSGSVPNHTHYLQVDLGQPAYNLVCMEFTRRPTLNDHITLWGIYGSNDADTADEDWAYLAELETPYSSNTESLIDLFDAQQYRYLRFYIDDTTTGRGYAHMTEFQLYALTGSFEVDGITYYIVSESDRTASVFYQKIEDWSTIPETVTYEGITWTVLPPVYVSEIALSLDTMTLNEDTWRSELRARVYPENAENKLLEWSSSNPDVAYYDDGYVYPQGQGETVITARATDGSGVEASCVVNVFGTIEYTDDQGVVYRFDGVGGSYSVVGHTDDIAGDIVFPETIDGYPVTRIEGGVFGGCDAITSVTIPASITFIGYDAFYHCNGVGAVYFLGTTPPVWEDGNEGDDFNYTSGTMLYVPVDLDVLSAYKSAYPVWAGNLVLEGVEQYEYIDRASHVVYTYYNIGNTASVKAGLDWETGCPEAKGNIRILESFTVDGKEYTVTEIGNWAFNGTGISGVTIPATITSIGRYSFWDCYELRNITSLREDPFEINEVFMENTYMNAELNVPEGTEELYASVPGWREFFSYFAADGIGYYITDFDEHTVEVTRQSNGYSGYVVVPASVEYAGVTYTVNRIGNEAFAWTSVQSVELPSSIEVIEERAFYSSKLVEITLPEHLSIIGYSAFNRCLSLSSIKVLNPEPVYIDYYTFSTASYASAVLEVPSGSEDLYREAEGWHNFYTHFEEDGIAYHILSDEAQTVEVVLKLNRYVGSVVVPETVAHDGTDYAVIALGQYAFYACYDLTDVTIPASIQTIGEGALGEVYTIQAITVLAETPIECPSGYLCTDDGYRNADVFVPKGCVDAYRDAYPWNRFEHIYAIGEVPDFAVNGIKYAILSDEDKTVEVVRRNGDYYRHTGEVVIPSEVTYNNITYTVKGIGREAFRNTAITAVTLPSSIEYIGDYAFAYSWDLQMVTSLIEAPFEIPNSVFESIYENITLTVPAVALESYYTTSAWNRFANILSDAEQYEYTDPETNVVYTYNMVTNTASVKGNDDWSTGNPEASGDVNILDHFTIDGKEYTVTRIGARAFYDNGGISAVTLPSTITSIGHYAFYDAWNLRIITSLIEEPFDIYDVFYKNTYINGTLNVPEGTEELYASANGWREFFSYFAADGIAYYITDFNEHTVEVTRKNNGYSGNIVVPASVENNGVTYTVNRIGSEAFSWTGIEAIELPSTIESIGGYAFYATNITEVVLPESVNSIDNYAFYQCTALAAVTVQNPEPIYISYRTFSTATYASAVLEVPNGSEEMYRYAEGWHNFYTHFEEDGIAYHILENTVPSVEVVLKQNRYQGSVVIPESVSHDGVDYSVVAIGQNAFYASYDLTEVTIPASIQTISYGAFNDVYYLNSVTVLSETPIESQDDYSFTSDCFRNAILFVPEGCVDAYRDAYMWSRFEHIYNIGDVPFFEVDGIKYAVLSAEDKTVEVARRDGGYNRHTGAIVIPSEVTYDDVTYTVKGIGREAFHNTAITAVSLPASIEYIGEYAFAYSWELRLVTSQIVEPFELQYSAFQDIYGGVVLMVPAAALEAYYNTYAWNQFADIQTEGEGMEYVDPETQVVYVYYDDSNVATVKAGMNWLAGSPYASGDITILEHFTVDGIEYTVTAIGAQAFVNSNITSVTIPASVVTIAEYAFYNASLNTITVLAQQPATLNGDSFDDDAYFNAQLIVPDDAVDSYLSVWPWNNFFRYVKKDGIVYYIENWYEHTASVTGYGDVVDSILDIQGEIESAGETFEVVGVWFNAYHSNPNLREVHIPATMIGYFENDNPFSACPNLTTIIVDADNACYDSREDCNAVIETASNTLIIGCNNTVIPESVTALGRDAFYGCTFTSMTIPASVTSIGDITFGRCNKLTDLIVNNPEPCELDPSVFGESDHNLFETVTLHVPEGCVEAYANANVWSQFFNIVEIGNNNPDDQRKVPYVRITGSGNAKTLAFYYGQPTEDALELAENYSFNNDNRAWKNELTNIETVVFEPSFAQYRPTSTNYWFYNMSKLTAVEGIENLNTSNVTSMTWMFYGCSVLTSLDVSNFNTSNVTDMSAMFSWCSNLSALDLSNFNTSNVTHMGGMFCGCKGLTSLDISNFETSNVTFMSTMFRYCSSLTSLDISNFNTSNVTNMGYMFDGCSSLATIYVGEGWNIDAVSTGNAMFSGCANLVGGQGSAYNEECTDVTYAHIDGGADNPGYFTAVGDIATGIAGMENDNASGAVYDMSGKLVGHSTSDIRHSSRKGLFIVNGKTVLVK